MVSLQRFVSGQKTLSYYCSGIGGNQLRAFLLADPGRVMAHVTKNNKVHQPSCH